MYCRGAFRPALRAALDYRSGSPEAVRRGPIASRPPSFAAIIANSGETWQKPREGGPLATARIVISRAATVQFPRGFSQRSPFLHAISLEAFLLRLKTCDSRKKPSVLSFEQPANAGASRLFPEWGDRRAERVIREKAEIIAHDLSWEDLPAPQNRRSSDRAASAAPGFFRRKSTAPRRDRHRRVCRAGPGLSRESRGPGYWPSALPGTRRPLFSRTENA